MRRRSAGLFWFSLPTADQGATEQVASVSDVFALCPVGEGQRANVGGLRGLAEELTYREYRIVLMPYSRGWQALIYAPGSNRYLPESPSTRDPAGRTSLRDTAKLIVDHHQQV